MGASMTILRKIYNAFNPKSLPADSDLYVDCKVVRGGADILIDLGTTFNISDQPTCQLYSGYRGDGKTIELLRLRQDLEQKGYIVAFLLQMLD
jgi:hypothetical protein